MSLNRSVQGDKVAVELLPEEEWSCPSSMMLEETETMDEKRAEDAEKEVRNNEKKLRDNNIDFDF
jgi:exosome complex exonuclease DIS3/RRP44